MSVLLKDENNYASSNFIFRIILFLGIFIYSFYAIKVTWRGFGDPDNAFAILHVVDLIFHESGHLIFIPFMQVFR